MPGTDQTRANIRKRVAGTRIAGAAIVGLGATMIGLGPVVAPAERSAGESTTAAPRVTTADPRVTPADPRFATAARQSADSIDWSAVEAEAARLLGRYIRINTANPPGNEIAAARFLRDVLIREGIEFLLLDGPPGKAALLGRIRSSAEAPRGSVILLNHMDVVTASPEHWSVDPFGGVVRDGYVWGRGALDAKGFAVAQLMAMILLKRHGPPLDRDLVFLATSDGEVAGGFDAGAFIEAHPGVVASTEYVINEGGTIAVDGADGASRVRYYGVGVTEKTPFGVRVIARGPAGHGSQPVDSSAVHRLIGALERIRTWETDLEITPPVAEFFRRWSRVAPPDEAALYRDIEASLADRASRERILGDRYLNALLRNTISITVLHGSPKINVIPPVASAELDVRLLPGSDPERFLAALRDRVGAGGDSLTVQPIGTPGSASSSPTDTDLYRAIEAAVAELDPGAVVLPRVGAMFSDSHYFREIRVHAYGLGVFKLTASENARVHGNDERVSLENLRFGTRLLYEILRGLGG